LQQPLQRPHRHIVAKMFADVGEVQHRPFRDEAEDILGVVTSLKVFVIGEPQALVLEIVRDAAGPDRVLVRELWQFGPEEELGADLRNAADAQEDTVQAFIERIAMIAVEEQQRLVLLQLAPKIAQQGDLPVGLKDPAELFVLNVRVPNVELFVLADGAEIFLSHPAVGRGADRVRRDILTHRGQLTEFERVVMRDRVATGRERNRVTGTGRLPAVEIGQRQARRVILAVVVSTVPDVLLDDAIGVLAGVVADVTVPGPVVPDQARG
jgi:hypothetical protein